ncbi:MAG: glutamate--tRNA ligase [Candidatus Daviesbacteria bacterium]|nr:MAG: glutamate--tRNA ligase [Candidatus Daviesbacteria bacterium]
MEIRTRMAPSPTGKLHLGTAYAALWPYLFAKKNQGTFILRIEDTDTERSTKEFAENIIDGLVWLGLKWDGGPFYQMERLSLYKEKAEELIKENKAYYCFCSMRELEEERKKQAAADQSQIYSGKCRNLPKEEIEQKLSSGVDFVIRFKLPVERGKVKFSDLIHGEIEFDSQLLGDMVIMRKNGIPLYNFVVVVDDLDMKITHVLRGDDHISNTPRQILLFEAFNTPPPQYGHYPMILNQDRSGKLSKRTGSTALSDYRADGFLPEAIINYLALLGWTPPGDREILSKEELIQLFEIKNMNVGAAAWNQQKLDWINGQYIRSMSDEELTQRLQEFLPDHPIREKIAEVVPLIKDRIKKLSDFVPLTNFLFTEPEYEKSVFQGIYKKENLRQIMEKIVEVMEKLPRPWQKEVFEEAFRKFAEEEGLSVTETFQLLRVGISGQTVSPPLFESMQILGDQESVARLQKALSIL